MNKMRYNRPLQAAKYGYLVISAALCVLGATLIAVPGFSLTLLCRIGGALMLLFGAVKIIGYLSKDLYRLAFQYDLAFGILLIVLGLILLTRSNAVIHLVCVLLGIFILADGLLKIQIALDARSFGLPRWWLILATAVATGIVGTLLLLWPSQSARLAMVLLGISILAEGILNLVTVLTAVGFLKHPPETNPFEDDFI